MGRLEQRSWRAKRNQACSNLPTSFKILISINKFTNLNSTKWSGMICSARIKKRKAKLFSPCFYCPANSSKNTCCSPRTNQCRPLLALQGVVYVTNPILTEKKKKTKRHRYIIQSVVVVQGACNCGPLNHPENLFANCCFLLLQNQIAALYCSSRTCRVLARQSNFSTSSRPADQTWIRVIRQKRNNYTTLNTLE